MNFGNQIGGMSGCGEHGKRAPFTALVRWRADVVASLVLRSRNVVATTGWTASKAPARLRLGQRLNLG